MNATAGKIIIDGNAACALGAMFAGVTVVTWYPITPSSSLVESLIGYMRRFRHDPGNRQGHLRHRAGRRRTGLHRHGARRRMGGRPLHDRHRRPGHLADVGIHRPRLLRRNSHGGLRRGTRRPLHRPAHAHPAGRPAHHRDSLARRHQAPHVLPVLAGRVLLHDHRGLRFRREVPDSGLRHDRSRPRHEQLDGRSVPLPREADRARQGADAEDLEPAGRLRPLQRCGWRWRRLPHAARHQPSRRRPTSRAAAATTKRPSTPSAKTITSTTWTAWRTSSKSCASTSPSRWSGTPTTPRSASWPSAPPIMRCAKAAISCARSTASRPAICGSRPIRSPQHLLDFIRRHDRVYVVDQNRDAQLLGLMRLEFDARTARQAAQRALLRRVAAGCAHRHRRNRQTGGQMSTTVTPPPKKVNHIGLEVVQYKGSKTTLVRRLRPQLHFRAHRGSAFTTWV